jgi:hypothetical protein
MLEAGESETCVMGRCQREGPFGPDGRPRNLDCTRTGWMLGHKVSVRHRKTQIVGEEAVVGWVVGRV